MNASTRIFESAKKVEQWVESQNYKGYEPFDGLSAVLRPLTFGNLLLDRLLLQLVRQSPLNLRPLLGINPLDSTIGRGYMAWGYCKMYKATGENDYKQKAFACLNWLIANKSPQYKEFSWGKHFDFASRGGIYRKFEPILIWTVLIGHAFMEAYETFKEERYLNVAESICDWTMALPRNQTNSGICLGYLHGDTNATIHNSNMMGAAFLARTAKYCQNDRYLSLAKQAMQYSCSRQLDSGGWLYGEDPKFHWIDNFHTGYNLDGLKCYMHYTNDNQYIDNLQKGLTFYLDHFFESNGRPKYYHDRTYPVDSQCAAQAIDTLSNFARENERARIMACKVALWTIENMQSVKGYFYYRQYPLGIKSKTAMLHWAQATTYKGLCTYILSVK